jgi:hypothetical protein
MRWAPGTLSVPVMRWAQETLWVPVMAMVMQCHRCRHSPARAYRPTMFHRHHTQLKLTPVMPRS